MGYVNGLVRILSSVFVHKSPILFQWGIGSCLQTFYILSLNHHNWEISMGCNCCHDKNWQYGRDNKWTTVYLLLYIWLIINSRTKWARIWLTAHAVIFLAHFSRSLVRRKTSLSSDWQRGLVLQSSSDRTSSSSLQHRVQNFSYILVKGYMNWNMKRGLWIRKKRKANLYLIGLHKRNLYIHVHCWNWNTLSSTKGTSCATGVTLLA